MPNPKFYAVAKGRQTGVFTTWGECESHVKGFGGAKFKSFGTRLEAEAFAAGRSLPADTAAPTPARAGSAKGAAAGKKTAVAKPAVSGPAAGAFEIFTDGGCLGNHDVENTVNPAGWGVFVQRNGHTEAELFGPVELSASSVHFVGAEVASNNTGELSAICEALLWLQREGSHAPARLRYDSKYAANIAEKVWRAHKNVALAERCQSLLAAERARRRGGVTLAHVKGHSNNAGNDRADALVQRGMSGERSCQGPSPEEARKPAAAAASSPSSSKVADRSVVPTIRPSLKRPAAASAVESPAVDHQDAATKKARPGRAQQTPIIIE